MQIKIIEETLSRKELIKLAEEGFGDLVKAVVDIEKGLMAIGGELHADEEASLLKSGSRQESLWGINLYPQKPEEEFAERMREMVSVTSLRNTEIIKISVNDTERYWINGWEMRRRTGL